MEGAMISKKADAVNSAPSPDITERKQARVKNEEKDREIWVGENSLYLGEDNIFYITVVGEMDDETAIAIKAADVKFKSMVEGKVNVLGDINKSGKHSPGARKTWKEMMEEDKTGKVAIVGMSPIARVLASFVMGVTRKKDMRFFKIKEEALAWLKQ